MIKDAYYFSHDSNAHRDQKIIKLRQKHNWFGYGIYWALIEMLRDETNYKLQMDYDAIAFALQTETSIIKSIIEDFGLFVFNNGEFYSESLNNRMLIREEKSKKARKAAEIRWNKDCDANVIQSDCDINAIKGKERKGKEIKTKESDKNIYSEQSSEIILSKLLYKLMLKNNPNAKQPNFQVWAKNIDKMIKLDNRTVEQIEGSIRWSQQDSFWSANILSTDKLRKQYDKLFLAAKRSKDNGRPKQSITESELRDFSESIYNDDRYK